MVFFNTNRLIVRSFKESDAMGLLEYSAEPRVSCFADEKLSSIDEALDEVKRKRMDESQLAVCLKENDALIGNLFAIKEEDTYSVGWNFNAKFEGKGYAKEAVDGLFLYLFTKRNARRIYCYIEEDNLRSQKLSQRLGMRKEGVFLEYVSFVKNEDGTPKYENTMQFAILKKEWQRTN